MQLKIREIPLSSGGPLIAVLNEKTAKKLSLFPKERVHIKRLRAKNGITCVINISEGGIHENEIGLFQEAFKKLNIPEGTHIDLSPESKPESIQYIKKKLNGEELNEKEINLIVKDIVSNELSEIELTYFVSGCYTKGLSIKETLALTNAMVENGEKLSFKSNIVVDKHCLTYDTPFIYKDHNEIKISPIGEVCEAILNNDNSKDIVNNNHLKALTLNEQGEIEFQFITKIFKVKSPKELQKIKLIGNREIELTEDHTIFILKEGKIINIPSKAIKKGDYVLVPSGIKDKDIISKIRLDSKRILRDYKKIPQEIQIEPEFVRLLAYYIAEGFTNEGGVFLNFGSHETKLIEDSIHCIKKIFHFEPTINQPHKTAIRVCMYSKTLAQIFNEVIKAGDCALNKKIPSFMFHVTPELKKEFLRTLIKGDGHNRRGYESCYVTSSKKLKCQLGYMLSLLGISVTYHTAKATTRKFPNGQICNIQESYQIYTQARELYGGRKKDNVSYMNLIPIKEIGKINNSNVGWIKRRALKTQKYITKDKLKQIEDNIESQDIKKILNGYLSVLEVKENKKVLSTSNYVYDIEVSGFNKFIAGTAPILIHNCIGGIAGNRTTLVTIPILASLGYTIPNTSSRAITSVSGTSDTFEVLAPVTLTKSKILEVVKKTNACMVWGGGVDLASADDKMIHVRHPLSIDPTGMMLASILAKKKATGITHLLMDIPYGPTAKIKTKKDAKKLEKLFLKVSKHLGIKIRVVLTDGSQPIGNGIGPALECEDVLSVLQGDGPNDLREKSIYLAVETLKLIGEKDPLNKVLDAIESGKAYKKMIEIIQAQGGHKHPVLPKTKYFYNVNANHDGKITSIDNKEINKIAMMTGAPEEKAAGLYLRVRANREIKKGTTLFTIYSNSLQNIEDIKERLKAINPITY
jgi:thymidine phosphorylase/intein/homing endonuclease